MQNPFHAFSTSGTGSSGPSSLPVFILDIGTRTTKAGLHTSVAPYVTPSITGTPKYPRCLPSPSPSVTTTTSNGLFVGNDARQQRGLLRLYYPVQHGGAIMDWEGGLRPLLRHSIKGALTTTASYNTAAHALQDDRDDVIYSLVESPFASRPQRARLAEMLFEGAESSSRVGPRAAGIFCGVGPLLALYATGQTTGIVVDVGDGGVSTAAAVDGYVLPLCLQHDVSGASGSAVTSYLTRLLYQSGVLGPASTLGSNVSRGASAGTTQERELVYDIKEACCSVSATPLVSSHAAAGATAVVTPTTAELNEALINAARQMQQLSVKSGGNAGLTSVTDAFTVSYTYALPDGHTIEVGATEAAQASEVLFYPSLMGYEGPGIVDTVLSAVASAPADVQSKLLENVVLTGGATCSAGFGKRVFHELEDRLNANNATFSLPSLRGQRVCVTVPEQRAHAGWLGASFVSQLSTFASYMVVTRAAYEEEGEAALAKKVLT